jgi:Tol biopolymer transport system component
MDVERWKKIDDVFDAALEIDPEMRAGFLAERCDGNSELRQHVEALLAAHEKAGGFIETSAMKLAARAVAGDTIYARPLQQVGPYRIVSLIGSGGMGEVYLAEDERLGRRIALKLLPRIFVSDPDRVRRFEIEARAASALNHPNILTIYDIGRTDETHYIAAEYVDGETLRTKVNRGRIPVAEAVGIATQVAEALSSAHAAGITHRDIKPENIVVRRDGYAKVVDFGLAKLSELQERENDPHSPMLRTPPGLVMGTVKYMSPEQVLGHAVDGRSDLWSLGVVLYEMLTAETPFAGATKATTFEKILNEAPVALTDFDEDLPPELDSIMSRALEKDPELRYQTASDLRAELRRVQRELEPFSSRWGKTVARLRDRSHKRTWRLLKFGSIAAIASVIAVGIWLFVRREGVAVAPQEPLTSWVGARSTQITDGVGPEYFPNLNPDGKALIYASRASGNWDIYWQRVGGKTTVNLTKDSLADDTQPVYSPDGNFIAFRSERKPRGIYVMESTSENPRRVTDMGQHPSWSPDGKRLVVAVDAFRLPTTRSAIPSALWIVDVATGDKRVLTDGDAVQPSWSPHGDRIAFWGLRDGSGQRDIWTISAEGGQAIAVTNDDALDWNPVWSPDGEFLYFASNRGGSMNFWRVSIDEKTGRVNGEPQSVTTPSGYSQHLSFSRDGKRMVYVQKTETRTLHRIGFDPSSAKTKGSAEAVLQGTRYVTSPDVSPDGERLVFSSQGEKQEDIFVVNRHGSDQRQLTNDHFADRFPRWSPDGGRIAFFSDRSGRYEVWQINADGTGLQQTTSTSGPSAVYPIWSPDGSRLVFKQRGLLPYVIETGKPWEQQTPQQLPPPPNGSDTFWVWSWSPDGRRLAGWLGDRVSGANYIHTYDFTTQRYEQLTTFGDNPVWLHDNRRLLFHAGGRFYIVDTVTKRNYEVLSSPPHEVYYACLTPDDRTLYFTLTRTEADIWLLSLD